MLGDERAEEGIDGSDRLGTECKDEEGIRWRRGWTDGTNRLKSRDWSRVATIYSKPDRFRGVTRPFDLIGRSGKIG